MSKKQFKTESKKLLDMMVNSIYTHKEIFLRELISNASDAIDKLYFRSLTDDSVALKHDDYEIRIIPDKEARTLTVSDNGCGMTKDELENNLGTIARSGSFDFKSDPDNAKNDNIDIIGQFGVGFYSAFMVADNITVDSKVYGSDEAYRWESAGADGYTVTDCVKMNPGTTVTLHIKPDTDEENYGDFLDEYRIKSLVKKYSDYIRYPIKMLTEHVHYHDGVAEPEKHTEDETLNSMVPIWKKAQSDVKDEEYNQFYTDKFHDYEPPLKVIRQKAEGGSNYEALMFIPSHIPFDYYSKNFEKGLQLYSSGVLIMDKCKDLLPDYFSFVKGLVDSSDLSLNISRELLQHDRQLKTIAKAVEKKINSELSKMLANERESYEKFFDAFGTQIKWGIYSSYGMNKDSLQDLIMFKSSSEGKYTTLREYVDRMPQSQQKIYYACGDSAEKIALLPQVESVTAKGYEVLYFVDDVDEFTVQMMQKYSEKEFLNVCKEELDLSTDDEKKELESENEKHADMFKFMQESLGGRVAKVRFTNKLQKHAVCLSSEGELTSGMEKVLKKMPGAQGQNFKAELVLEINKDHPIASKLGSLYESDKDKLSDYCKLLYSQARLLGGMTIDDPAEFSELLTALMI